MIDYCSVAARLMGVIASEAKQSLLFEGKRLPRPFRPRNDNSSNYMRQSTIAVVVRVFDE